MTSAWDPTLPGQRVRLRDNPGKQGSTTGRTRAAGARLLVQVAFGPGDMPFKFHDQLELCDASEDLLDLLVQGRFGSPADLRRILTFEKLEGRLTNIFYSMESSNTEFFPHQFKPVLKFLDSPVGRLLIADEVGLGKTIEAIYVWKELQARSDARRLLIVCPAMLREKWRTDLLVRFGIDAEVLDAATLLHKLRGFLERDTPHTFACIASLEGLRPPSDFEDEHRRGPRVELARLLDANAGPGAGSSDTHLLDLVIVDEAHYMRNQTTANNRLGTLLRDAARHLLLLTATPIQIHSANLFQLLRLVSPEDFFNEQIFNDMLLSNAPVTQALRLLWQHPPDLPGARAQLEAATKTRYFVNHPVLSRLGPELARLEPGDLPGRVRIGHQLESCSLLGQYMTRNRKRDVIPNRVQRQAITLQVQFTEYEKQIYEAVTKQIRQQARGLEGVSFFSLVARQRQMASSMVAALQGWQKAGYLEELMWEDFGALMPGGQPGGASDSDAPPFDPTHIDLPLLERTDRKYRVLSERLKSLLRDDPREKLVIFAYFRGTLAYLQRRLEAEGIRTALIMGDMGDSKWDILRAFKEEDGPNVLLSSEVGSEGIDLQFCRVLVNYDLPWNPMRVEQRIGRLDRLGQRADRIAILNLSLQNTIEERILERLYERIGIFRDSIGDLEEILGTVTEQLLTHLFSTELTDAQREERADATLKAMEGNRLEQKRLEDDAVNLLAFSDYILDTITHSQRQGRYLHPDEVIALVRDFFQAHYPGTLLRPAGLEGALELSLSNDAKVALQLYLSSHRLATATRLHQSNAPIVCLFDPRKPARLERRFELLEPTHPLLQWIRHHYAQDRRNFHPVAAVRLSSLEAGLAPGHYVFMAHRWTLRGLRGDTRLAWQAARVDSGSASGPVTGIGPDTGPVTGIGPDTRVGLDRGVGAITGTVPEAPSLLSLEHSERLVSTAALRGEPYANAVNLIPDLDAVIEAVAACDEALGAAFAEVAEAFEAENTSRCDVQEKSARGFHERRQNELLARIERFRAAGQTRVIPATEGLLRTDEKGLQIKLELVRQRRQTETELVNLAAGVILVE